MSLVPSKPMILVFAIALGTVFSILMGAAAKVEAGSGTIVAHLPMFIIGAGAAWFGLMVARHLVIRGGYRHD